MAAGADVRLPAALRRFPGAVVHLSREGLVLDSNGRLEAALGREIVGRPFAAALDAESSGAKWARVLAEAAAEAGRARDARDARDAGECATCELVLRGRDTLAEPRTFSVLPDPEAGTLWLAEHPRDERLDHLRELAVEVNSELASAQRELLKERGRLARALERIEAQHAALQAATRELERSNRALDEFAQVASHDLKAPLRSIAHYAEWAEEDAGRALPAAARAHLEQVRAQVARMRALVDGILAYARAGREQSRPEAVDVAALVHDVVATLDPPPGVTITVDDGLPTLWTERAPLRQVFQNLIGNAVAHARRDDPRVRVSGRPAGGRPGEPERYEFAVADNGAGIPPGEHERIWTLFHTGASTGEAAGTGIGLAIVRRLVESHGGTAWVESVPGAGATFRFHWPVRAPERS